MNIGSFSYIKRIKAQVFLDYANIFNRGLDELNNVVWYDESFCRRVSNLHAILISSGQCLNLILVQD